MAERTKLEILATTVQVFSVVIGVIISVVSLSSAREKEALARIAEAEKPLQELRRKVYVETVKNAAIISTPDGRTPVEMSAAKQRFRELYVAELSMVEQPGVESAMVNFAEIVDPQLLTLTPSQQAALDLSRALRDSYISVPKEEPKKEVKEEAK